MDRLDRRNKTAFVHRWNDCLLGKSERILKITYWD
jgi:hypothetical protein